MNLVKKFTSMICTCSVLFSSIPHISAQTSDTELNGWLMWHSYSSYSAMDSKLYVRSPDGEITEVSGDFKSPMNGDFGSTQNDIVFMAIDEMYDEWDIYLCKSGKIENLTKNSGYRNEDPKFSPDGRSIVFKRGYWSSEQNDFVYDLALLDLQSGNIAVLTDTLTEEAMPYFSDDGDYIYYADYSNASSSICRLSLNDKMTETVFSEYDVNAYYPVCFGQSVYFTKWISAEDHTDSIIQYDGKTFMSLPFNSAKYNCSDACPVSESQMIYSSSENGSYDLYFYDGQKSVALDLINSDMQELGAAYFSKSTAYPDGDVNADGSFNAEDVIMLQKWLLSMLNVTVTNLEAGDLYRNGRIDVIDLCMMKQLLLSD